MFIITLVLLLRNNNIKNNSNKLYLDEFFSFQKNTIIDKIGFLILGNVKGGIYEDYIHIRKHK